MVKNEKGFNITYTEKDGLLYPDLTLPEQSGEDIGRFGRMRRRYLKEHRKALFALLTAKLELNDLLREINRQAEEQIELITSQLARAEGINEELKARDQLGWVQAMNSCKARAEELVIREMVLT
ncbi:MAG: TnpV protein [Clostridia bacterium]|nr:TnpV protein [Clostridia bacterium]